MTIISIASYTANKIVNHYIFNRSDIVSAIGAFTVGILGNVYSRKMGGTAFTSMVTGVLFLVPVSLANALLCVSPDRPFADPVAEPVWSLASWRYQRQRKRDI